MWWRGLLLLLMVTVTVAKGKKQRHHKPGRAVLDRLSSTNVGEIFLTGGDRGLAPAPVDVAVYASIEANATCGFAGPEEYCRDTPGKRGTICDVCDGSSGSPARQHPAPAALDGSPATWWQSPTLSAGEEYAHVELVAVLPDKMELLHVIIKSGPSPRPLAWSLEVSPSEAGDNWRLVKAFGDREHCRRLWDLRPERRRRKARAAKRSHKEKPSCSTQFASPKPLENGEMHVAIGEGTLARRVRVSFRAPHPLPAAQQYYTVRELTLAARCICHGHADTCRVDSKGSKCECQHDTCGQHCQRCCAGGAWRAHAPCEAARCACGERGLCELDDTGAILCVNCTDNRAGPLCDRCLVGFYNAVPDGPCLPCDCDSEGSDGSCNWDYQKHEAQCSCNPGFTGPHCDLCEDPSATFPSCLTPSTTPACKCDPRGIIDPSRTCDEVCECKANVVGERCDTCAPGHFGLNVDLPTGCRPCYCSRRAASCVAQTEPSEDISLPLGAAWRISDLAGNNTVDPELDDQGKPFLISEDVEDWESYYWMTAALSGSRLSLYGSEIRASMFWGVVRGDTGGNPTEGPDVILLGADGTKLAFSNTTHEIPGLIDLAVPLFEDGWYNIDDPLETIDRSRLMDVLADLRGIMLRAHFHMDQDEVRLESASIAAGAAELTEVCQCGAGYAGAQCERCAWSYARLQDQCVPCDCNNHADCDSVGGPCGACQHNTTGLHCERCLPGHYGNPVQGSCKPCACPLYEPSNNFSPNCAVASTEGDEFVCTQCPDGYSGDHCEQCDSGYWGSPTTLGGSCAACACGGAACHPRSGACHACPPHAEGAQCERCQEGYWASPAGGNTTQCAACACGGGALAAACDARSGQCACRAGWRGRACDACADGHGGIAAGCPACRCGEASMGASCDPVTGACACAAGAAPPACDQCLPEYYGLTREGCVGCNCSALGSESAVCDIRSGQCRCKPHVTGRACDTCEEGYWGLQLGGCRRCACGAGAAACEPTTGLCACAAGVGGDKCDRCLPGFYGFGPNGCLPCPECEDGKVCSAESGRCVCPARTRGAGCRRCAPGAWRSGPACLPCQCGPGAVSNQCDASTGSCVCRAGWAGAHCDRCAAGHAGARCRPCACDPAGSAGPCDESGRCPCKLNVVGDKCDRCLEGTFGLSADNALGCTACFCFGRGVACAQASLARAALHAAAPTHLTLQRATGLNDVDQDSLLSIHTRSRDASISIPEPPVPVYMELGPRFLGDKVTSYGGFLKFRVEEEGGDPLGPEALARFPLVRIYGRKIVLDYYERIPPDEGWHSVRLYESLWQVRGAGGVASGAGGVASRSALMLALSKVERILLRVSTRAPTVQDKVHALLLNVSLDTTVAGHSRAESALGVELCACDARFAPPSCHAPAPGFWMPDTEVHFSEVGGTIVITLEGEAQPCNCNGRAAKCDPDTGHCINCTAPWSGPTCSACAAGYYPAAGACAACACRAPPCPRRHPHCQCPAGYTGRDCTSCSPGYYRTGAGACAACGCHARGALSAQCDARGRCRCRPHAAGDKCDQCVARTQFLHEDGCRECDNCTQTLLNSVENLTTDLHHRANINELSRIPKPYPALLEFAHNASVAQTNLEQLAKELEESTNIKELITKLEATEHEVFTKVNKLKTEAVRRAEEASFLSLESMTGLEEAMKFRQKIGVQVMELDEFARGEKHTSAHKALKEAKHLLRLIKDLKLNGYLTGANDVFDSAHLQSTAIQEYKYRTDDLSRRLTSLLSRLDTIQSKSEDFRRFGDVIWDAGDVVEATVKEVKPKMAKVKDVALRCRIVVEDIASLSPHNLTLNTNYAILSARTLARHFPSYTTELKSLSAAAEEKEGILYELTPKYREKYLKQVERHVEELSKKAKEYKSVFAGARAASSAGVEAARAWGDVAGAVRAAARAAAGAQAAATAAAALARPTPTLKDRARESEDVSRQLRERAIALLKRAEELRGQLEQLRRGGDVVSIALRSLGWQERELAHRPRANVQPALRAADTVAERVFATTRALYDEASEVRRRVRYSLRRTLAELQRHADTAVSAAQEHVSQILRSSERGAAAAAALGAAAAARRAEQAAAGERRRPALDALRRSVASALHAAGSISVSITSVPGAAAGCARQYAVRGRAAAVSRFAVDVSFDGAVRDGPLLAAVDDTKEPHHYIKLMVLNQHFHLTWELGGGTGLIIHPDQLLASHDDADHTSYRVQIDRIWNTVHLTLEKAGQPPSTASNSTAGSTTLLPHKLLLGGPEGGLPGCVHSLKTRDEVVGLWSGIKSSGKCTGCTQRFWSLGAGRQNMVYFNGRGYAALRRSELRPADPRHFSISFSFRTMDQDALLFLAVDEANNRWVSVSLVACRVVFTVQYARARLRLAAAGRHCAGRAAHVQATRVFSRLDKGSLRVNGEETLGSPSPPVQSLTAVPDLSRAVYWVGGVGPALASDPPGAPHPPGAMPALRGCIGGVTVNREGYDLMDTTMRHGAEPVCGSRSLYSAIFDAGYVELPWPILRRKSALGLSFKSRSSDGLLLYRVPSTQNENDSDDEDNGADEKHYLVIQMVKGEIEVIASAGKDEVRLSTNGTKFDDKKQHSLRLIRQHKQIELWIDDTKLSSATFAGNAIPARSKGLFLGGISESAGKTQQGKELITAGAFEGTIADLIVDSTLIGFEAAVNWTNVQLGRSDIDAEAEQKTEPRALQSQPDPKRACSKTSSYTVEAGAAKFGDVPNSYARLRTAVKGSEIVYSLQFRTYAPNGLLLFAPGPKSKPKHYVALVVRERRLRLLVRGRKRREVSLPHDVTDGTWRTVWVRAGRGRAVLRADGAAAAAAGGAQRARHVLLGGAVPSDLLPRPIAKVGGFRGCIRHVTINGRPEDIVRDAKSHRGLGQCFPNVEPGAYFGGDAYAVWTGSYSPGAEGSEASSELRLEFRAAAASGVLLAAPPLLLMLKDGVVVFSRTTASGTVSAEWRGAGPGGACDGRWHAVLARASHGALALQVDGSHVLVPAASLLADERAPTPLYVCAVPEGTIDASESKEPFRGCIRNLSVGGHKKDWSEMDHLHNVLLDSCPAQQ